MRQVGASVGTALLAVVRQHQSAAGLAAGGSRAGSMLAKLPAAERARVAGPLGVAFAHTMVWSVALAVLAIVPAVLLFQAQRESSRTAPAPSAAPSLR